MPVKLVRSDTDQVNKVTLPAGTSFLGRGTLLQVYDKKVSRKHAEVEVTDDSVIVKALHHNPCFYTKNGSNESQTLNFNSTVVLSNADKIGLLPKSYWFEIIIIEDSAEQSPDSQSTEINNDDTTTNDPDINETFVAINNDTSTCSSSRNNDHILPSSSVTTSMNADCDHDQQALEQQTGDNDKNSPNKRTIPESDEATPKKRNRTESEETDELRNASMNADCDHDQQALDQQTGDNDKNSPNKRTIPESDEATPKKRNRTESEETDELRNDITQSPEKHNPSDTEDVKRVKVEPIDTNIQEEPDTSAVSNERSVADRIKVEPTDLQGAGPGCSATTPNSSSNAYRDMPPNSVRERCYYGARCYRRNPLHLAEYSHPRDSDWGPGDKGECPYGGNCVNSNPRHWDTHYHPPGTSQLTQVQALQIQRHGRVININPQTTNVRDTEDSDESNKKH